MNFWIMVQLILNLIFLAGIIFLLINRKQTYREDQKFSKGLQLLQTKISVLEDLSDQTDDQVRSLTKLLEDKYREIQGLLVEADQQIQKMEEVAQNTMNRLHSVEGMPQSTEQGSMNKYVKAAQMAHSGASMDEILQSVDLTRGEVELVMAMNKDNLVFNQHQLPLWVNPDMAAAPQESTIGAEFLKALKGKPSFIENSATHPARGESPSNTHQVAAQQLAKTQGDNLANTRGAVKNQAPQAKGNSNSEISTIYQNGKALNIKPFEFKRIQV